MAELSTSHLVNDEMSPVRANRMLTVDVMRMNCGGDASLDCTEVTVRDACAKQDGCVVRRSKDEAILHQLSEGWN